MLGMTLMIGACVGADDPNVPPPPPLTNKREVIQFVRDVFWSKEGTDVNTLIGTTITNTKEYFEQLPQDGVLIEITEWRKAKKVEIFWHAARLSNDIDISDKFLHVIHELLGNGPGKNFRLAKYLLISQCTEWDEANSKFKLDERYDQALVSDAFGKLYSATNGDIQNAQALISKLSSTDDKFKRYLALMNSSRPRSPK
jgi:hypothetical protein